MVEYIRKLDDVPGFSEIPLPGHKETKAVDKILIDPVTGSNNFMLMWSRLNPESGTESHIHPVEQSFFVLNGALKIHIAGKEYTAERNSAVLIPAGEKHQVTATGKDPAIFLVIFSPPLDAFASRPH